ncbi:MAG: DUF805 domain-containing protein [Deltaproteobacteria bacterium]|jgi:uncharacterized membrane protein YhaH (DUF805 family)|nr:DUF805 domain-containing protein [Deltaproteobacteria bacterium]
MRDMTVPDFALPVPSDRDGGSFGPIPPWHRSFFRSVRYTFLNVFTYSGRASRAEYRRFFAFEMAFSVVLVVFLHAVEIFFRTFSALCPEDVVWGIILAILLLWTLASALVSLSLTARRFHDYGMTGALAPLVFLPLTTFLIGMFKGNPKPNRFGPPFDPARP